MGCINSLVEEPQKKFHPFNCPVQAEHEEQIYEILEFWFESKYTAFDRTNHIKPLNAGPKNEDSQIDQNRQSSLDKEIEELDDLPANQIAKDQEANGMQDTIDVNHTDLISSKL